MDLGIFQETKVTRGIYMRESGGYQLMATEALSAHSRSVAVFYREAEHFALEALLLHGTNIVSFYLASGWQRWYAVG